MTARDIQRRLLIDRWDRSTVFPNFTPPKWWECDLFEMTKAGFFREYEIKLTTGDFRRDAKKTDRSWTGEIVDGRFVRSAFNKHEMLKAGAHEGPSKFYFVAPVGIIPLDELPSWAGLIVCEGRQKKGPTGYRTEVVTHVEREAPQLHKVKADRTTIERSIHRTGYWRFLRALLRNDFTNRNETEIENQTGSLDSHEWRDQTKSETHGEKIMRLGKEAIHEAAGASAVGK